MTGLQKNVWFNFSWLLLVLHACAHSQPVTGSQEEMPGRPIAFPGAEGFGQFASGGRGGKVYIVTNLQDSGEGSLRQGVTAKEPLIIVFAVSGTIHLSSPLSIKSNKTIAGQTAPGDGICLADQPVSLGGDNIILRYLRVRLGDRHQGRDGKVDGSGDDDALGGTRRNQIIVDHCSISWSTDECFTVYGGDSTTLQWNIISEPLNYSYHFETGDADYERHGFGGIWGGAHLSAHHNLFAHCLSRNPRFNGTRLGTATEFVDYRNNVIYNWGNNNVYGGEAGRYNVVNNYYRFGPSTQNSVRARIVNPSRQDNPPLDFGKFFVEGNYVDGAAEVSKNNWLGIHLGKGATEEDKRKAVVKQPFPALVVLTVPAEEAYEQVLAKAGCSLPVRDTLDDRIIRNVRERTGAIIDVQGGYPHGTPYEKTSGAWPVLVSVPSPPDSDQDGMPDAWETQQGLNPADASDAGGINLHRFYTNIEMYINSLVK